jgi:hypothetical protein
MKKNKMMRFASVLLVAVLLSTCAISGTFAKYTSTVSGTATATVANWDVKVAGQTDTFIFNLFDTLKDSDGSSNESDVDTGVNAPGTSGESTIADNNNSQVNAKCTVGAVVVKADGAALDAEKNPIEFVITNGSANIGMGVTDNITVTWTWEFGETDEANANDLELAGKDITVVVPVTVEQVD